MGRKLCVPCIAIGVTQLTVSVASVGLYTIQIAAMYGFKIITTCSPKNFDLVKKSGATHVFDYSDPDVVKKIVQEEGNLRYVFDTIGNEKSSVTASQAISEAGGGLCTVRPDKSFTQDATKQTSVTAVLVWTAYGREQRFGDVVWPVRRLLRPQLVLVANQWSRRAKTTTNLQPSCLRSCLYGSRKERSSPMFRGSRKAWKP
jgi:Zn-dependent alcohol dehydrogenase